MGDGNVHSRNSFLPYPLPTRERMELDQDKDLTPAESGYAGLETEISLLELLMVGRHKRVLERVLNPTRVTPLTRLTSRSDRFGRSLKRFTHIHGPARADLAQTVV